MDFLWDIRFPSSHLGRSAYLLILAVTRSSQSCASRTEDKAMQIQVRVRRLSYVSAGLTSVGLAVLGWVEWDYNVQVFFAVWGGVGWGVGLEKAYTGDES